MTSWTTKEEARAATETWPEAASMDDARLQQYLDASTEACIAYAPSPLPDPLPESYKLACLYQAKEIHQAAQRDGDVIGIGDYAIRSRPLTGSVKQLLRPEVRMPVVG